MSLEKYNEVQKVFESTMKYNEVQKINRDFIGGNEFSYS